MTPAREIRKAIRFIPGAWVRVYCNGKQWAGAGHTRTGMEQVRTALEAAGYRCECNGEPGTAGEFIVEIFEGTM